LAAGSSDVAHIAVTLAEVVQGVITLTMSIEEATESIALVVASIATVLINLANGDLDGGMVIG
ncbi:uncharacterized protein P174DRAFT_338167, partial [Aspergillus novofumigatus IBT 16806]